MQASEHILLESPDAREVPEVGTARKVHARLKIRSRLRGHVLELALLDYCYLAVRTQRWHRAAASYVLDLRVVDPAPRLVRHVAWRWLGASALLATVTAAIARHIGDSPDGWWQGRALPVCLTFFGLALGAMLVSIYRTTET